MSGGWGQGFLFLSSFLRFCESQQPAEVIAASGWVSSHSISLESRLGASNRLVEEKKEEKRFTLCRYCSQKVTVCGGDPMRKCAVKKLNWVNSASNTASQVLQGRDMALCTGSGSKGRRTRHTVLCPCLTILS